jgi:hypothetical protein
VTGSRIPAPAARAFAAVRDRLNATERVRSRGRMPAVPAAFEERPYSYVFRATVDGPHGPAGRALFVKIFKEKAPAASIDMAARVRRDHDTTLKVHDFLGADAPFGAVRPVECYDDLLATVTEEIAGENLLHYLEREMPRWGRRAPEAEMLSTFARVGRWLRAFQAFDAGTTPVDAPEMIDYVDHRLKRLTAGGVLTEVVRNRILERLAALVGAVAPDDLREVVVHADFAPGNVMVDRERVVVIDFAMMGRGTRLLDLTRMHFQLDLLCAKPWFRQRTVAALQAALVGGFDSQLSPRHPLFQFLLWRHRINHLGTVTLHRGGLRTRLVNAPIRRMHLRWLDDQLSGRGV